METSTHSFQGFERTDVSHLIPFCVDLECSSLFICVVTVTHQQAVLPQPFLALHDRLRL